MAMVVAMVMAMEMGGTHGRYPGHVQRERDEDEDEEGTIFGDVVEVWDEGSIQLSTNLLGRGELTRWKRDDDAKTWFLWFLAESHSF